MLDAGHRKNDERVARMDAASAIQVVRPDDGVLGDAEHLCYLCKRVTVPDDIDGNLTAGEFLLSDIGRSARWP
jgi:hypothetical protein